MLQHLATKPVLLRIGLLLAFVVALGVVSMLSSVFIARSKRSDPRLLMGRLSC